MGPEIEESAKRRLTGCAKTLRPGHPGKKGEGMVVGSKLPELLCALGISNGRRLVTCLEVVA
jgi:hypothetical protein